MREIKLTTGGKFAIVDDDDYEKINKFKWSYKETGYAIRTEYSPLGKKKIAMHRFIMKAPKGLQCDHINGNRLDNRKENLRICTSQQNNWNRGKRKNLSSIYRGVHFHKKSNKWTAVIRKGSNVNYLGLFINETDAAIAYNKKAVVLFGEYARLNIIL